MGCTIARKRDEARRLELATAAVEVLRQQGLQNTSMRSLAESIGVKRSTFYWYFGDISEILLYFMDHVRAQEAAWVVERIQGLDHPLDVLGAFVRAEHGFFRDNRLEDFVILLCQYWALGGEELRLEYRRQMRQQVGPVRDLMVGMIEAGIADGRVRPCNANALVEMVLATLDGAMVHGVLRGVDTGPTDDFLDKHLLAPLRMPVGGREND